MTFDNWKLHQYGELCGFETLEETFASFDEFHGIAKGAKMTLKQSKNLSALCSVVLDINQKEAMNRMFSEPSIIADCISTALDNLPKPHAEDQIQQDIKKKAEELLGTINLTKQES